MSKKSIEEQFSIDLEKYKANQLSDLKIPNQDYMELLMLGKSLKEMDYSKQMDEEKLRQRFTASLEKESKTMKKSRLFKRTVATVASVAVLGGVMTQTAFGQEVMSNVIKIFSTGHSRVIQENYEVDKNIKAELPEEYKGKLFDKDGKCLEYIPYMLEGAYGADGKPALTLYEGKVITDQKELDEMVKKEDASDGEYFEVTDPEKINDYTAFTAKLPTYLPEGVKFEKAEFYQKDKQEPKDSLYVGLYFVDAKGKEVICMQERLACEETATESGTYDEVKEVDINGAKGLMYDNSLDWETKEIIYYMHSKSKTITDDEMLKVARSFK